MKTKKEIRKQQILERAREIYPSLKNASLNTIIRDLQLSKSSFYNLFSSQTDFYLQLFQFDEVDIKRYYDSIQNKDDLVDIFLQITSYVHKRLGKVNPLVVATIISSELQNTDDSEALSSYRDDYYFTIIRQIINDGINNGQFKPEIDIDAFVNLLNHTHIGITLAWGFSKGGFRLEDEIVKNVSSLIHSYLK